MSLFKPALILALALPLAFAACNKPETDTLKVENKAARKIIKDDKFTYSNYDQVQVTHLDLNLNVDFDRKILSGVATLDFEKPDVDAKTLILDTKDLTITDVAISDSLGEDWTPVEYAMSKVSEMMGQSLTVPITNDATKVKISYFTSPEAEGLQWLAPAQTAGKEEPYLFSQAQAINARTITPVQDTPAARLTYSAT